MFSNDGKHLFSLLDGEIRCEDFKPLGLTCDPEDIELNWLGGLHFSGLTCGTVVLGYSDGKVLHAGQAYDGLCLPLEDMSDVTHDIPIVLTGSVCDMPDKLMEFAEWFPSSKIYACPVIDGLAAIGNLVKHGIDVSSGYICPENNDDMDTECLLEFDWLNSAIGKMAMRLKTCPVINETRDFYGLSSFYGRVLSREITDEAEPVFLIHHNYIDEFFPHESLSAKSYIGTTVPILMKSTEKFKEETGFSREWVRVFIVTGEFHEAETFMNWCHARMGLKVVMSYAIRDRKYPSFRYNKLWSKL